MAKADSGKRAAETGRSRRIVKEIYGIFFLMAGVFLTLCLISFSSRDPSFTSSATNAHVHNLGGVVGSYLADLFFNLLGYAAYLVPLSLAGIALLHLSGRHVHIPALKIFSYLLLILLAAVGGHVYRHEEMFGGRLLDAGGLVGWWLGGLLNRFFGQIGTTLLLVSGGFLVAISITQLSLIAVLAGLRRWGLVALRQLQSLVILSGGRLRTEWDRLQDRLNGWWRDHQRAKRKVKINAPPKVVTAPPVVSSPKVIPLKPLRVVAKPVAEPVKEQGDEVVRSELDPALAAESRDITLSGDGPKILPRVDLKEGKAKLQLEMAVATRATYQLPQLSLLDADLQGEVAKIDEEGLRMNSRLLEQKLLDYGVAGNITEIHPGPIITMYEFVPAPGVKVNKVVNLEDDLSMIMGGKSVRIIAPIPGKAAVGIEIPNNHRETVWLKDAVGHAKFQKTESRLTLALGKDTEGIPFVADLAKMPHLLMAGATGVGKSVALNSMVVSFLYKGTPDEVRLIMIDLKMLELSIYEGIPHLLLPVVTNAKRASQALRWAVSEMERRYELLSHKSARHIAGYNKLVSAEERLPLIVVFIDELADLMMTASRDVEVSITRLAQMARAAGIHLILATQRPSVDVLTGLIKANFPARISFKVTSKHDSRTIIDMVGAEHLLGSGDMLFMSGGASTLQRIHGAYVSETEILRIVEHWKKQGDPKYLDESVLKPLEDEKEGGEDGEEIADDLYDQAIAIVSETRQASISMIQRRLRIGYNRAARMIEKMEKEGVVGPADGARPREVYVNNLRSEG